MWGPITTITTSRRRHATRVRIAELRHHAREHGNATLGSAVARRPLCARVMVAASWVSVPRGSRARMPTGASPNLRQPRRRVTTPTSAPRAKYAGPRRTQDDASQGTAWSATRRRTAGAKASVTPRPVVAIQQVRPMGTFVWTRSSPMGGRAFKGPAATVDVWPSLRYRSVADTPAPCSATAASFVGVQTVSVSLASVSRTATSATASGQVSPTPVLSIWVTARLSMSALAARSPAWSSTTVESGVGDVVSELASPQNSPFTAIRRTESSAIRPRLSLRFFLICRFHNRSRPSQSVVPMSVLSRGQGLSIVGGLTDTGRSVIPAPISSVASTLAKR